jgi:hypothetical protein
VLHDGGIGDSVGTMRSKPLAIGLLVVLLLAVPALAVGKSAFKLTTKTGKTKSFSLTGYAFSSRGPKLGKSGSVEVDVSISSPSEKLLLKTGTLKSASIHIVATLPKPVNTTYKLLGAKITSVSFVDGNLGPVAAVKLSYAKLAG